MSKKLICSFSVALLLVLVGSASAALVGHWQLDDGSGTTAVDSSGNVNNGTLQGAPQWVAGFVAGGLELNGTTDYVDCGSSSSLDITAEITIAVWVKVDVFGDWDGIVTKGITQSPYAMQMWGDGSLRLSANWGTPAGGIGGGSWNTNTKMPAGEWIHAAILYDGSTLRFYIDGQKDSLEVSQGLTFGTVAESLVLGCDFPGGDEYFDGVMDDVRIYDHALTDAEITQLAFRPKAYDPNPPDGATGVTGPLLSWAPGTGAKSHDVYLGTDEVAVTNATSSDPMGPAEVYKVRYAYAMWWELAPWIPGATYYWRVDEVDVDNTTIYTGDVWSFTAASLEAFNPDPPDGAKYVDPDADLSWTPGSTAFTHDVYFGTDQIEVTNGTGGTFKVNQPETAYDPGTLARDTRYYWRIDEVEQDETTKHTGNIWSFKTLPDMPITDPNLLGWWKFDEGEGTTAFDWSGHDNHGTLRGDPQWVFGYAGGAIGLASPDSIVDIPYSLAMAPAQAPPRWAVGYDGGALEFDGIGDYVEVRRVVQDDFTLMAWIKTDTPGAQLGDQGYQGSGLIWSDVGGVANDFILAVLGTKLSFFCGNPDLSVNSDRDIVTGEWVHVAATRSAVSQQMAIYIDGQQERTAGHANAGPLDALPTIAIGGNVGDSRYYTGLIDEVRAYQKTLTQQEIKQAMRGDPLLAWNPRPANGSTPDIEGAASVSWSPGDEAARHDVYFGTDRDAVEDADTTTTGIYRGRQDPNTYTPPEGVEFGQTYYWRIDEFNTDATIREGRVWGFTVADYLIVDDFESYDDYCNRIFYVWPDGWGHSGDVSCGVAAYGGNGTGSTVGYLSEPYAEQTIVLDGEQSMPLAYLNDGSTGKALYSETERTFDTPQDWTRHGVKALTLWFRGQLPSLGSFSYSPATDIYTMTADGADIHGQSDEFHYAYKQLAGQGSMEVKVESIENTHPWALAGVMIRETLEPNSVNVFVLLSAENGIELKHRQTAGGDTTVDVSEPDDVNAPHWLRLTRTGNTFTGEHSADGSTWEELGTVDFPMSANTYIGLALTSHSTGVKCTAVLSGVASTGSITGQWQSQDIGIASNDAEQLYVVVEDSTGKSEVVNHPDPCAVQSDTWQEWNIDLNQVGDAGVNLQSVKKMYVGLGDRDAPKLGGSGMLYIDDIRLYRPRCLPDLARPERSFNNDCAVDYEDLAVLTEEWLVIPGARGLQYEQYEGDWDVLPNFDVLLPARVGGIDNFDISQRTQDDYFGFRFTGQIDIATAGDYTFYTTSDDGSQLYISDVLVVDNDGLHGMVEQLGTISLTAGMHPIIVTMFEKGGGEGLDVEYEGPGITRQPIPDDVLYRLSSVADLNGDGTVDARDYALLAEMFLNEVLWP